MVCCNDIKATTNIISKKRNHGDKLPKLLKIGIDGDMNSIKLVASFLYNPDAEASKVKKKRITYAEGLSACDNFKETGVNKVIILGVAPGQKEEYGLFRALMEQLDFSDYNVVYSSDLKAINVAIGVQSNSATYGMYTCDWKKGSGLSSCTLRDFKDIRDDNKRWIKDTDSDRSKLKNYHRFNYI